MLNLRFMLSFLTVICPKEFFIEAGSIRDIMKSQGSGDAAGERKDQPKDQNDDLQIFEEIMYQVREFFINRNLDGKSLFRVLSKQAQKYFSKKERGGVHQAMNMNMSTEFNYAQYKDELLCKVFELVFVVAFFCKDSSGSQTDSVFDKAINNLCNSAQSTTNAEWIRRNQNLPDSKGEVTETPMGVGLQADSLKHEVNSLLTKSVIQIVGDVLKQFTAVLPNQAAGQEQYLKMFNLKDDKISFKNESAAVRKSSLRKYNFD